MQIKLITATFENGWSRNSWYICLVSHDPVGDCVDFFISTFFVGKIGGFPPTRGKLLEFQLFLHVLYFSLSIQQSSSLASHPAK